MNNNRQPNNRRRNRSGSGNGNNNNGRNNNNNRNGFDGQNRIDNRARGNASQMLEKYKKMAADALHIDDRVNAEYYLQFADHYFRVLADTRLRQEERQDGQQARRQSGRDDAQRDETGRDDRNRDSSSHDDLNLDNNHAIDHDARDPSSERNEHRDTSERYSDEPDDEMDSSAPDSQPGGDDRYHNDNGGRSDPALKGSRQPRSRTRAPRNEPRERVGEPSGLDISILPPSIALSDGPEQPKIARPRMSATRGDTPPVTPQFSSDAAEKPLRKPRVRRPKAAEEAGTAAE